MKRNGTMPLWCRFPIALCVVLVLAVGLAEALPAQAQGQRNDRTPSKLWKTYPLDPSKGKAPLRRAREPESHRVGPPSSVDTGVSAGTDVRDARQPSEVGGDDPRLLELLTLYVLGVLGLLLLVLVGTRIAPSVANSFARVGSLVASPMRAVASVPRHRPLPRGAARAATTVPRHALRAGRRAPASPLGFVASRWRALRNVSSSAASHGAASVAAPSIFARLGSGVAAALRRGVCFLFFKRYQIALYAFVVVAGVTLGAAIALFLGGA